VGAPNVKHWIDEWLLRHPRITSGELASGLAFSRQAAHAHLRRGVADGWLVADGSGRTAGYRAAVPTFGYPVATSAEDRILADVRMRVPELAALPGPEAAVVQYALSEMVNNALDHSGGSQVDVRVKVTPERVVLGIDDDGVGAFARLRDTLGLGSLVEAAAELTKGKVTTQPERHSGEGIFFTSRSVDRFELWANGLQLVVDRARLDVAILARDGSGGAGEPATAPPGTQVRLLLLRPARRTLQDVFAEYTVDLEFSRTRTVVRLFGLGKDFVSRSEARRLMHGLERFRQVVLDFEGVPGIGQGFADEVFRVFATAHPGVELEPVNMNEAVRFFVDRACGSSPRRVR
jgi:anti-sigma regulatory factor (Ser/Thr protein kinase)